MCVVCVLCVCVFLTTHLFNCMSRFVPTSMVCYHGSMLEAIWSLLLCRSDWKIKTSHVWPVSGHLLEKSCSLAKLAEVSAALVAVSALAVLSCEELDSKITQCICQHDLQVGAGKGSIGPQLQAVRSCHPVQSGITCHPARDLPNGFRLLPILSEEPVRWADVAHDGGCQA